MSKNIKDLIGTTLYNNIAELHGKTTVGDEFELIFSSKGNKFMSQEKYINILKYLKNKKNKYKLDFDGPMDTLDIIYANNTSTSYRISLVGNDNINTYMRRLDMYHNHVIFSNLMKLHNEKNDKNINVMKKIKDAENTIDIDDLDIRARLSKEENVSSSEMKQLSGINETQIDNIIYRLKHRFTLYVHKTEKELVKIDITVTKTNKNFKVLNKTVPNYELEVEYNLLKGSPTQEALKIMINECELLTKIMQQSNYILTNSVAKSVVEYYRLHANVPENNTNLDARQPISLEIQHIPETLPDKYAVTDKADGERYFLIVMNKHVYFISGNLNVRESGIDLETSDYDGTILDGEYIFISKENRHLFMVFDCLFVGKKDIRGTSNLMKRLDYADEVINKCFIFGKQKGYKRQEYRPTGTEFSIEEITKFHSNEINKYFKVLNEDIQQEKQYPLIRRKYFIDATGGKKWEIFKYSELIWNKYTGDSNVQYPYHLDGLIFQPLEQAYVSNSKESKLYDFKWKPPQKNSIDFFIRFEKDKDTGKILTVYDNSDDEKVKNKPYRICKLYVGKRIGTKEQPVLFRETESMYWAYLYLQNGEVRDVDGNILSDETVVEFYYNDDGESSERFRWVPLRTRYDKTESVLRFGKRYGNYIDIADKVWRSIMTPILMSDFSDLAKGNNPDKNIFLYDKKIESLKNKIGHEIIVSAAKENVYYQKISNLVKDMRQFHNWLKSINIYTYCHPMYQDNKQLSVLDIACGRGGDILKFYYTTVAFYVGIDVASEGLTSAVDGAISRYNQSRKTHPNFPKMYFIHGDAGALLEYESQARVLQNMTNDNKQLMEKFFSLDPKKRTMFDRINCQFAVHYFLKDDITWSNFKQNLNMYLRNGGYFMTTTFDAHKVVEAIGDKNEFAVEYTDDKGKKQKLFEIVKKYGELDMKKPIKTGQAIDVYTAWLFQEGNYVTEYLVDKRFFIQDLLDSCDLELVDTDLFENQFNIHKKYFKEYSKYFPEPDTAEFLSKKVAKFFEETETNKGAYKFSFLTRYYVFRKKDKSDKMKGGNSMKYLDFSNPQEFAISDMSRYDNDYSYFNSIHDLLRMHKIIPKTLELNEFLSDVGLIPIQDKDIDISFIKKTNRKFVIENEIEQEGGISKKMAIDGLNVFVVERDCNDNYDIECVTTKSSNKKNSKAVILMREGDLYRPIYKIEDEKKKGIFKMSDPLIEQMMKISDIF